MRLGVLAAGAIGLTAVVLVALGVPSARKPAPRPTPVAVAPAGVSAGGVTLTSARIALPDDAEALPSGPHVDLVTARCTACHSAGMILRQPPLSAEQWAATVTKMREAYKAPVDDADVAPVLAYLTALKPAPAKEP